MILKKMASFWCVALIVGLYTTFVLQQLWNWFVATSFHVPEISYWVMYGIQLAFGLLSSSHSQRTEEDQSWKIAFRMLAACVPEEKRDELKETLEAEMKVTPWIDLGSMIFGQVIGNTIALTIGWGIHGFLQ
jgi:hypothetical protein